MNSTEFNYWMSYKPASKTN